MIVDLRHLSRTLRRSPASAVAAVVTLSLTLGAGAAIFALVDAVLLTPPPFANPETLVIAGETPVDDAGAEPRALAFATFQAWRDRAGRMAAVEAFDGTNLTLTGLGAAERVNATNVTPGFLALLGVEPAVGRTFSPDETAQQVLLISYRLWRGRLAGDPNVAGRELVLGGERHTIIGVLPERFFFGTSDVWRPFPVPPAEAARQGYRVGVIARLAPGVTATHLERAFNEVSAAAPRPALAVVTAVATAIAGRASGAIGLLAGAGAIALLIAFTNLTGLLIVRSIDRRRELSVRSALGAPSSEIARQLLLEAGVLVIAGTAGGVLLAWWITPAVGRLALEQFGAVANRDIVMNWRVIGALFVLASACAGVCGLLPAMMAARRNVVEVLRRGVTAPPRERFLRRLCVVVEVALAFVLLVSMTFLGRSLIAVLGVNPGFDPQGVLKMQVSVPAAAYADSGRVVSFYTALQSALDGRLGAGASAIVDEIPLSGSIGRTLVAPRQTDVGREAVLRTAGTAYFNVMRIPVVAGRPFDARDDASAPPRVVVSMSLAERLFGSAQPIGRRVRLSATAGEAEVIGVAGDVRLRALDQQPEPTVYLSAWQVPSRSTNLVVRSSRPEADVIAVVRQEVARLDRDMPVYGLRSMSAVVAASPGVPARRVLTATFVGFALLAVVLGAIGLFGVVAHEVAARRLEIALRIALGADPLRVLATTCRHGAVMVGAGLLLGGALSLWTSRTLGSLLVSTTSIDVVSASVASCVLIAAGALAVVPAARRAARTNPLIALHGE